MSAIISKQFKVANAQNFIESITDATHNVYAFIGRQEAWAVESTPPTLTPTAAEVNEAYGNMLAMKKVTGSGTDLTHLIPRVNWTYGGTYNAWNDNVDGLLNFYVMTEEGEGGNTSFNVYKCLYAPAGTASTVKPDHLPVDGGGNTYTSASLINTETDGYVWQYMYTIESTEFNFVTNSYIPVKAFDDAAVFGSLTVSDQSKYMSIEAAKELIGNIYVIEVTNGGSGYQSAPTVTITGDGSSATATATLSGDSVDTIVITATGSGYTYADVTITDNDSPVTGSGATARAVINYVSNPVIELGGYYVGVQSSLTNSTLETDELNLTCQYRQLGLIQDPRLETNGNISTASTLSANLILEITPADGSPWTIGSVITGNSTGAQGIICSENVAGSPGVVYLHVQQTPATGYGTFTTADTAVTIDGGSGATGSVDVINDRTYQLYSGDIIYLENKTPIQRSPAQTEDLRLVIEF